MRLFTRARRPAIDGVNPIEPASIAANAYVLQHAAIRRVELN
jgi:hypothetical protein